MSESETYRIGAPPTVPAQAPPVPGPRQGKRTRTILIAAVAAVLLAAAGVSGWLLLRGDTISVTGHVEIAGDGFAKLAGGSCQGDGGYSDIRPGAQVVVTDAGGTTIAIGRLGGGSWIGSHCELPFEVDVPGGSDFYGIQIASRNTVQYEADRLSSPIVLTIGD